VLVPPHMVHGMPQMLASASVSSHSGAAKSVHARTVIDAKMDTHIAAIPMTVNAIENGNASATGSATPADWKYDRSHPPSPMPARRRPSHLTLSHLPSIQRGA